jgi:hypothetical protein
MIENNDKQEEQWVRWDKGYVYLNNTLYDFCFKETA